MRLKDFDEGSLIRKVMGKFALTARAENFDDAVIIDLADVILCPDAPYLVYSIDQPSFVKPSDPSADPFRFYGRWVAGVTCNDIIAMGARCRGFSLALAAPPETEVTSIESLLNGVVEVLDHCDAVYEGGNFDSGDLATVGFAWGIAPRRGIIRRSGAKPGDLIVVTGELGLGWLDYQIRQHRLEDQIAAGHLRRLHHYKDMPVGAAAAIACAAEEALFTSGMDLSDGLVDFLYTLVSRSGVGCVIDLSALPVSEVTRHGLRALLPVLPGAADPLGRYPELIALEPGYDSPLRHGFTVAPGDVAVARRLCAEHGTALHVIGRVVEEPLVLLDRGTGGLVSIPRFWDDQLRQEDTATAWLDFINEIS